MYVYIYIHIYVYMYVHIYIVPFKNRKFLNFLLTIIISYFLVFMQVKILQSTIT